MHPSRTVPASAPQPKRVLMVEDSPGHALLVRNLLTRGDEPRFEVDHATRLDEALASLEEHDYDALILDLGLPDAEGLSTLGSACSLANHVTVVVLTGTDSEVMALAALRAGAQEYLVKGRMDYRALPATILRAIERHRRTSRALGLWHGRVARAGHAH